MKPRITIILFGFCVLWATWLVKAQQFFIDEDEDVIQFFRVVVDVDSLSPVPYASIIIKNSRRSTLSDVYEYFLFVALKNDTIVFSSMGYKKKYIHHTEHLHSEEVFAYSCDGRR